MKVYKNLFLKIGFFLSFLFYTAPCPLSAQMIFTAIHCEPDHPNLVPELPNLVAAADSFHVPLTIMLSPPWAEIILNNEILLDQIRQWQINGHEIATHHHGPEAGNRWDGYTNLDSTLWPDASGYKGNMEDYYKLLSLLAGDSLMLTACIPAAEYDWVAGIPFRTEGHSIEDAVSQPEEEIFLGQTVYTIRHCFTKTASGVNEILGAYENASRDDIVGLVMHVQNFHDDPLPLKHWFQSVQGRSNKIVRNIMRSRGIATSVQVSTRLKQNHFNVEVYPNPMNPTALVEINFPVGYDLIINVYNIRGEEVFSFEKNNCVTGVLSLHFDGKLLTSGLYVIRAMITNPVKNDRQIRCRKVMLVR